MPQFDLRGLSPFPAHPGRPPGKGKDTSPARQAGSLSHSPEGNDHELVSGGLAQADRQIVAWALADCGGPEALPVAEALYRDGDPSVRMAALRYLAKRRREQVIPELRQRLLQAKPRKLAQEAFWQMFRLGEAALPTALAMLESEHWPERKAAACLLRRWGKLTPEQRERVASDPHVAVRHAASPRPEYTAPHPVWGRRRSRNGDSH